ncbi:MAG TPA: HupE/UreJ family protein [Polyangiales bacterium]|nr:HupE/UreJ family protein [Polyangiales bacterium]
MMRSVAVALGALLAFGATHAFAHELTMAELELRELSRGQFILSWGASGTDRPIAEDLRFEWPEGCQLEDQSLRCGERGLFGRVAAFGLGKNYSAALVRIVWLDRQVRTYTLTAAQASVYLYGGVDDARAAREIAWTYLLLGIEHIATGIDHLLFVVGLLFLVGVRRRLIGTITAFTLAHSLTLACSVLGLVSLRSPPVEACIALSIVLVASEALRPRETLARKWPALVAFLFGLVHGLGFAGALREVGLPENHIAMPLLMFNVGVELGQLMAVLMAYVLTRALSALPQWVKLRVPALYAIGGIAAYWSWLRIAALGG